MSVCRGLVRYQSRRPPQQPLRRRLRELAGVRVRAGYKHLYVLLRREGWPINHKRVVPALYGRRADTPPSAAEAPPECGRPRDAAGRDPAE